MVKCPKCNSRSFFNVATESDPKHKVIKECFNCGFTDTPDEEAVKIYKRMRKNMPREIKRIEKEEVKIEKTA